MRWGWEWGMARWEAASTVPHGSSASRHLGNNSSQTLFTTRARSLRRKGEFLWWLVMARGHALQRPRRRRAVPHGGWTNGRLDERAGAHRAAKQLHLPTPAMRTTRACGWEDRGDGTMSWGRLQTLSLHRNCVISCAEAVAASGKRAGTSSTLRAVQGCCWLARAANEQPRGHRTQSR